MGNSCGIQSNSTVVPANNDKSVKRKQSNRLLRQSTAQENEMRRQQEEFLIVKGPGGFNYAIPKNKQQPKKDSLVYDSGGGGNGSLPEPQAMSLLGASSEMSNRATDRRQSVMVETSNSPRETALGTKRLSIDATATHNPSAKPLTGDVDFQMFNIDASEKSDTINRWIEDIILDEDSPNPIQILSSEEERQAVSRHSNTRRNQM